MHNSEQGHSISEGNTYSYIQNLTNIYKYVYVNKCTYSMTHRSKNKEGLLYNELLYKAKWFPSCNSAISFSVWVVDKYIKNI